MWYSGAWRNYRHFNKSAQKVKLYSVYFLSIKPLSKCMALFEQLQLGFKYNYFMSFVTCDIIFFIQDFAYLSIVIIFITENPIDIYRSHVFILEKVYLDRFWQETSSLNDKPLTYWILTGLCRFFSPSMVWVCKQLRFITTGQCYFG